MAGTTTASSCLPSASGTTLLSSPSLVGRPVPSTFVTRTGARLQLDGVDFRAAGPNIYWLGLDENVDPSPSWPSTSRVQEVVAIASAMGANAIRSTTLGVSVGTSLSVMPSLGEVNEQAFAAIDWAIWVAKSYGMRLIIPLTDQYDYYHGGIPTFLRFRNLSASSPADYGPFYDTSSPVFADFASYVTTLLTHRSNITGMTMAEEPAILAFETGNELGGWGGRASPPPVDWTTAIARLLKRLAPNTLVLSGSYGVRETELGINDVDIYSDHFYPPYSYNLKRSASLTSSHNKAFIAGEYDWTDQYYKPILYLAVLVPFVLAALLWLFPGRWWPWRISAGRCCCCRRRRRRKQRDFNEQQVPPDRADYRDTSEELDNIVSADDKASQVDFDSPAPLPTYDTTFPPRSGENEPEHSKRWLDRTFLFKRWHLAVLVPLVLSPVFAGVISVFLPTPTAKFLATLEADARVSGSFYWSLFGRDDACCRFVEHGDGYTLHYPSSPTASTTDGDASKAAALARHAWSMQRAAPSWLATGQGGVGAIGVADLPGVVCPQTSLALPANATWKPPS